MIRNKLSLHNSTRHRYLNFEKLENRELLAVFAEKVAELPDTGSYHGYRPQNYFQVGKHLFFTKSEQLYSVDMSGDKPGKLVTLSRIFSHDTETVNYFVKNETSGFQVWNDKLLYRTETSFGGALMVSDGTVVGTRELIPSSPGNIRQFSDW
jgi:hypothetical protein